MGGNTTFIENLFTFVLCFCCCRPRPANTFTYLYGEITNYVLVQCTTTLCRCPVGFMMRTHIQAVAIRQFIYLMFSTMQPNEMIFLLFFARIAFLHLCIDIGRAQGLNATHLLCSRRRSFKQKMKII